MINLKSTGRKDDLESLFYILTFLYKNTLPVIDYLEQNLLNIWENGLVDDIRKFR